MNPARKRPSERENVKYRNPLGGGKCQSLVVSVGGPRQTLSILTTPSSNTTLKVTSIQDIFMFCSNNTELHELSGILTSVYFGFLWGRTPYIETSTDTDICVLVFILTPMYHNESLCSLLPYFYLKKSSLFQQMIFISVWPPTKKVEIDINTFTWNKRLKDPNNDSDRCSFLYKIGKFKKRLPLTNTYLNRYPWNLYNFLIKEKLPIS